ncbi:MAG: substrate-binding domain-containing protein, partial [Tateyamaria sp.]
CVNVAGLEHADAAHAMLQAAGIPVVEIMDTDGNPVDNMVGISHRQAGLDMAKAILKQGYSRIGFMGTSMPRDHRARKRFEGLTEGLAKAGVEIEARDFYEGGSALAKGREMTKAMLDANPDLDFLYYSNDMIGAGGLLYLLDEGIDVPGQIGLAGFNGVELLQGLPRQLATTDACRLEIGRAAAEIIRDRNADGADPTPKHITLTPTISYGDTLRRALRT